MPRSSLRVTIELLESNTEIERKILQGIAIDFNTLMLSKISDIRNKIDVATVTFLKNSQTYTSLISGELAAHFGLPSFNRQTMVDNILRKIGQNIEIEFIPVKVRAGNFTGGANIQVLVKDFSDILSMIEATIITEKGQILPWLEWVLTKGDKIIISEHDIRLVSGKGRSGQAIMVKNSASAWRVPTAYSGVVGDNWLTRFFDLYQDAYLTIITNILQTELG
jgi:hypothetical protein